MAHETKEKTRVLQLPVLVVSPTDVGRLIRELEQIDDGLLQLGLRAGGDQVKMPKTSRLMDQAVAENKLNLLQKPDRAVLLQFLNTVRKHSPLMHMSFSADPSPMFLEKLVSWLRQEVHPLLLLTIGLQPNIGAGCIVRTTNKQFDFSLRQDFANKRDLLLKQLALPPLNPAPAPAATEPAATPAAPAPAKEPAA
ncbi:MAG TPA: hypothetical protein VN554_00940 [Verrucomicrobiae bacterium]|nr:hypothetical protein [Verrucomicrobiae bacterium]